MNTSTPKSPADASTDLSKRSMVALEFFKVAKDEILIRIRVRDTLLAAYAAGAFTGIAAIIASSDLGPHYLYGIPYLSLAFCLLVSYHHAGIGAIGNHCATDLLPHLAREVRVLAYEYSNVYHRYHKKNATRRVLAHAMILLLPSSIALVVNIHDLAPENYAVRPQFVALWAVSLVLIIVSYAVILRSNRTHFEGFQHKGDFPNTAILDDLPSQ